jgi:hypothetical protein
VNGNDTTTRAPAPDPLDMARNLTRTVEAVARYVEDGGPDAELQAHVRGLGPQQHHAAEMAGQLALVSIAADLRRIADHLTGTTPDGA